MIENETQPVHDIIRQDRTTMPGAGQKADPYNFEKELLKRLDGIQRSLDALAGLMHQTLDVRVVEA